MSNTKSIEVKVGSFEWALNHIKNGGTVTNRNWRDHFLHINGDFLETAIMVSFLSNGEITSRAWHGHTMELMSNDWVEYFL